MNNSPRKRRRARPAPENPVSNPRAKKEARAVLARASLSCRAQTQSGERWSPFSTRLSLGRDGTGRVLRFSRPPGEYLYWSLDFADRKSVSVLRCVSVVGVLALIVPLSASPAAPRASRFNRKRTQYLSLRPHQRELPHFAR